ncbi:MAG: VWA domain-containing protein [Pyrinomonadaceae bacterium]
MKDSSLRLVIFLVILALECSAQDETVRVESATVQVPVSVYGRDGTIKASLKKDNFKLFENGVEQEIAYLESGESPFTVMLLADLSGSLNEHKVQIGRAIDTFIGMLRPNDTVVVATFDSAKDIDIRVPPTLKKDYSAPKPPSSRGTESPYTITFDAVDQAIKYLGKLKGRRAIVLFGDGELWGMKATAAENLRAAEESESTFFTIRYGDYPLACVIPDPFADSAMLSGAQSSEVGGIMSRRDIDVRYKNSTCAYRKNEISKLVENVGRYFNGLSERTAGRSYQIAKVENVADVFKQIITEMGQQFTLGYEPVEPGKDGERRKITVKVNIPNVAVRSRNEVIFNKK